MSNRHYKYSCDTEGYDYGYHPSIHEETDRCFDCEFHRRKEDLRWKNVRDGWTGRHKDVQVCVWCIANDWQRWRDA